MSRAGAAERGFTLLELLVVLTLVALLAGVALPRLQTMLTPSFERTARRVALAVRDQRTQAILSGRLVSVSPAQMALLLPAGTQIVDAPPEESAILFFPNGTSTGGRIVLAARDGRRAAVAVDWLTGQVSVGAAP
jgi:general secretion pathway protein H